MHRLSYSDVILTTRCPDCGGRGSVRATVPITVNGRATDTWNWCFKCDGTGRILKPEAAFRKRMRTIALVAYVAVFAAVLWAFVHWNANIDRIFDQIDRSIGIFR